MAAAKDKVQSFISDYQKKLRHLQGKLQVASKRLEEVTMEVTYVNSAELPKAKELRVIDGDSAMENKVLKLLAKQENEQQDKQEEVLVLESYIRKYKVDSANSLEKLERLFRDEKRINDTEVFNRILKHKEAYISAMKKEAETLVSFKRWTRMFSV
jgi:hypothetical protein